jgi:hypothetical protein
MVERGSGFGFLNETFDAALLIGVVVWEEFESDMAAEFSVLCPVHLTHTSRTDFGNDAIAGYVGTGGKFCHGRGFTSVGATVQEKAVV